MYLTIGKILLMEYQEAPYYTSYTENKDENLLLSTK